MITNRLVLKHAEPLHEIFSDTQRWKYGTCEGLWIIEPDRLLILAIKNNEPHNGHFIKFMHMIEKKAAAEKKDLYFISFINPRFKQYLKNRGYNETVVKILKDGEITDGVVKHFGVFT